MNEAINEALIKELDKNLTSLAIILAEAYAARCGMPSIPELLKEAGITYEKGKCYGAHIQALQKLLIDEYKVVGLDLVKEVEKSGEKFVIGKFSKYENKLIVNKLQTVGYYTDEIRKIKENN